MHTAYHSHQILKLPLTVESLTSYEDNLLVGTKQGHLLMYSVVKRDHASPPKVQLLRTNKFFSKKSIVQLAAVPEYAILVSLCDSLVAVHDIDASVTNFPTISAVERTKGASVFALDVVRQKTLTGEIGVTVRMVVAVKRRLQFYYWKNRKFHDLFPDVSVPDIPKFLAWSRDCVCVGFRGEYSLIKLGQQQDLYELFPTGKNQTPNVILLADKERFALGKDEQTTFIDLEGNLKLYVVTWSEPPLAVVQDLPYLLAVTPKAVEVKTEEPRLAIQTLDIPKARFITTCKLGVVYVASQSQIWCLQMVPVAEQIPQLLLDKQFELAVILSGIGDDSLDSKAKRVQQIQTLCAFDLFCNLKFKESMDIFYQLDIDTSHVIGLFADLLPQDFRNQLSYPDNPPVLQGKELENATLSLVEYLTRVRHKLNGTSSKAVSPYPIMEGCVTIKSKRQMLQILDTTLLKCYLRTNDALVAPLLRLKENQCHLEETERALIRSQRYAELIIFYNTRGLHKKALSLLKEHAGRPQSSLRGPERTVQYLQNLGPEHVDVIFEFAEWVLKESDKDGLSIFTEDVAEVEALPRAKVLDFLLKTRKSTVIPYLKHVILEWRETNGLFHNALVLQYKDYITGGGLENNSGSSNLPAFAPFVSEARVELQELLKSSSNYTPELVLPQFPLDCLEEERAVLLASLGRHKEALTLFLYRLKDVSAAKEYCNTYFKPGNEVFSLLFSLMLVPPDAHMCKNVNLPTNVRPPCDLDTALDVLNEFGSKIDLLTVLKCLPDSVMLNKICDYLNARLEERTASRNHWQVLRSLKHAEHLQVQEERIVVESQRVKISEYDVCYVCHRRFKNQGAFVRMPDKEVVHLSCQDGIK